MDKIDKISTAREFEVDPKNIKYSISELMIEFAKLHVTAALEEAYRNAELEEEYYEAPQICYMENSMGEAYVLSQSSIINAYPLGKIK